MSFKRDVKEAATGSFFTVWVVFLYFALFVAVVTGIYFMKPTWLGLERAAFTASHQYIESARSSMQQLALDYVKPTTSPEQKEVIKEMLKRKAQNIPSHEIPQSVRMIISR